MPDNTVKVDRSTPWGNPFLASNAVASGKYRAGAVADEAPELLARARAELRGKNLACWCALDQPCHADVWLELTNEEAAP